MEDERPDWERDKDDDNGRRPPSPGGSRALDSPAVLVPVVRPDQPRSESPPSTPTIVRVRPEEPIPDGDGKQIQTAILGPVASGKTYLFQAIVHRLHQEGQQGVMTRYLAPRGVRLFAKNVSLKAVQALGEHARIDYNKGDRLSITDVNETYRNWDRLDPTRKDEFRRYTLLLDYRTGWLGGALGSIRLSFFDCAGELHEQGPGTPLADEAWGTYRDAQVVVFCLPAWAAFPGELTVLDTLPPGEREDARRRLYENRSDTLKKFARVVEHYTHLWQDGGRRPVRVVLALTQADSMFSGLQTLAARWVRSYVADSRDHLSRLARLGGPTQYLAAAREISNYVAAEFSRSDDYHVRSIPGSLGFDDMKPWIIPVSAIDGEVLDKRKPKPRNPPEPAHVELPLLLALCEAHNTLM